MSDEKNPFSMDESTAIFARRVLDNARVVAQEAAKQEQRRVLMKREVRAEVEERLPEISIKAVLVYARGECVHNAILKVTFCQIEAESLSGDLSERDAYRLHLLTVIGYDPAVEGGKLVVRLRPEEIIFEELAPAPSQASPQLTQDMYLPPAVLSGMSLAPLTSPPPVMERIVVGQDEGLDAGEPLPDPPGTDPGNGTPNMPSPVK